MPVGSGELHIQQHWRPELVAVAADAGDLLPAEVIGPQRAVAEAGSELGHADVLETLSAEGAACVAIGTEGLAEEIKAAV